MDESWYHCYLSKCELNLARDSCLCHQGPFWQRDPIWAQNQTGVWRRQTVKDESRSRRSPSWTWLLILMYYLRAAPIATACWPNHHITSMMGFITPHTYAKTCGRYFLGSIASYSRYANNVRAISVARDVDLTQVSMRPIHEIAADVAWLQDSEYHWYQEI